MVLLVLKAAYSPFSSELPIDVVAFEARGGASGPGLGLGMAGGRHAELLAVDDLELALEKEHLALEIRKDVCLAIH